MERNGRRKEKIEKTELIVERGLYGPLNDSNRACPIDSRSVTLKLREMVREKNLLSYDGSLNAVFGDPCPGKDKWLSVFCRFKNNGRIRMFRFSEDDTIHIRASLESGRGRCVSPTWRRNRNMFEILPRDVVRNIFRYVRRYQTLYCSSLASKALYAVVKQHVGLTTFESEYIKGEAEYVTHEQRETEFFNMMFKQSQRQLRHLHLVRCVNVTDFVICSAAKCYAFENLETLKLDRCQELTDVAINCLSCATRNLRVLVLKSLSNITDRSMTRILKKNAYTLEVVNLSGCRGLTDLTLYVLRDELVRLRKLYLTDLYKVSDDGVSKVLNAPFSKRLQELTLWSVHRVTLREVNVDLDLKRLSSLSLRQCFNIQDDAIDLICKFMRNLVNLNISYCHKLSDNAVDTISKSLLKLKFLNLQYVRSLTDRSSESLARLPLLEALNVSFCKEISENAFIRLCCCSIGLYEVKARNMGFTFGDDTILRLTSIWKKKRRNKLSLLDISGNLGLTSNACRILNESLYPDQYTEENGTFRCVTE